MKEEELENVKFMVTSISVQNLVVFMTSTLSPELLANAIEKVPENQRHEQQYKFLLVVQKFYDSVNRILHESKNRTANSHPSKQEELPFGTDNVAGSAAT